MLLRSRASWILLYGCFLALLGGMAVALARAEGSRLAWTVALVGFALLAYSLWPTREQWSKEAQEQRERDALEAAKPLEVLASDIDEAAGEIQRRSMGLAIAALGAFVLALSGPCFGRSQSAGTWLGSGLSWLAMAMGAWYVRSTMSRAVAGALLLVPLADLVAVLARGARSGKPDLDDPILLGAVALYCLARTLRYHHCLRATAGTRAPARTRSLRESK